MNMEEEEIVTKRKRRPKVKLVEDSEPKRKRGRPKKIHGENPANSAIVVPEKQRTLMTISDDEIADELEKHFGLLHPVCKVLGVCRSDLRARIHRTPELLELMEELRESNIDLAENKLMQLVEQGHFPSINLLLRSVGKARGYSESLEIKTQNLNANMNLSKLSNEELDFLEDIYKKAAKRGEDDSLPSTIIDVDSE